MKLDPKKVLNDLVDAAGDLWRLERGGGMYGMSYFVMKEDRVLTEAEAKQQALDDVEKALKQAGELWIQENPQ